MVKGGSDIEKLKIRFYAEGYRGLIAKRNYKKGETIMCVPLNQMITYELACRSPIGQAIVAKKLEKQMKYPKHCLLGIYLL